MCRGGLAAQLLVVIRCGLVAARPSLQAFQIGGIHVFRATSGMHPALASRASRGTRCILPGEFGNGNNAPAIRTFSSFGSLITADLQPPATRAIKSHVAVSRLIRFRPLRRAATNPDLSPTPETGQPIRVTRSHLQRLTTPTGHLRHRGPYPIGYKASWTLVKVCTIKKRRDLMPAAGRLQQIPRGGTSCLQADHKWCPGGAAPMNVEKNKRYLMTEQFPVQSRHAAKGTPSGATVFRPPRTRREALRTSPAKAMGMSRGGNPLAG